MAPKDYNNLLHICQEIRKKIYEERKTNRISASDLFNKFGIHPEEIESNLLLLKSQGAIRNFEILEQFGIQYAIEPLTPDPSSIDYFVKKLFLVEYDRNLGELKILGKSITFKSQKHRDFLEAIFSDKSVDAWAYTELAEKSNDSVESIDSRYKGVAEAIDKKLKSNGISDFFLRIGRKEIKLNNQYLT